MATENLAIDNMHGKNEDKAPLTGHKVAQLEYQTMTQNVHVKDRWGGPALRTGTGSCKAAYILSA